MARLTGRPLADYTPRDFEQLETTHENRLLAQELDEHFDGGDDE